MHLLVDVVFIPSMMIINHGVRHAPSTLAIHSHAAGFVLLTASTGAGVIPANPWATVSNRLWLFVLSRLIRCIGASA